MDITFLPVNKSRDRGLGRPDFVSEVLLDISQEGRHEKWLINCGPHVFEDLRALGITPLDIEGVILTGVGRGFAGGLEALGLKNHYSRSNRRPKLFCPIEFLSWAYFEDEPISGFPDLWEDLLKHSMGQMGHPRATLSTFFEPHLFPIHDWHYPDLSEFGEGSYFLGPGGPSRKPVNIKFIGKEIVNGMLNPSLIFGTDLGNLMLYCPNVELVNKVDIEGLTHIVFDPSAPDNTDEAIELFAKYHVESDQPKIAIHAPCRVLSGDGPSSPSVRNISIGDSFTV